MIIDNLRRWIRGFRNYVMGVVWLGMSVRMRSKARELNEGLQVRKRERERGIDVCVCLRPNLDKCITSWRCQDLKTDR